MIKRVRRLYRVTVTLVMMGLVVSLWADFPRRKPFVRQASDVRLRFNQMTAVGGTTATGTVHLARPATVTTTVALRSDGSFVNVPPFITLYPGQASTSFPITTYPVASENTATITASIGEDQVALRHFTVTPSATVTLSDTSAMGGNPVTARISLVTPLVMDLTIGIHCDSEFLIVPDSYTVRAGQVAGSFRIATRPVAQESTAVVTLTIEGGQLARKMVRVLPAANLSIPASPVLGGLATTGTVSVPAALGADLTIGLVSDTDSARVPPYVTLPAGRTKATFPISTHPVGEDTTAIITSSIRGIPFTRKQLTVVPAATLSFPPGPAIGGSPTTVGVSLPTPLSCDLTLSLSSDMGVASVPPTFTLPAGRTKGSFAIETESVDEDTTATISISVGNAPFMQKQLTIVPRSDVAPRSATPKDRRRRKRRKTGHTQTTESSGSAPSKFRPTYHPGRRPTSYYGLD